MWLTLVMECTALVRRTLAAHPRQVLHLKASHLLA